MNDRDWQIRVDLAAAFRLAAYHDMHEGIDNHFTYALDDSGERYLLNPFGLHWSEVTASSLLEVDGEGKVIEGEGEAEESAVCIHGPIHRRHPQGRCVLHTHMPYATSLSMLGDGHNRLEPASQTSLFFYDDVAYDDSYSGVADSFEEGERMAGVMQDKRVLFLANHGVVVACDSISRAFHELYFLERACQAQILAMSTGKPLRHISDNVAPIFRDMEEERNRRADLYFIAMKRILDRDNPGYDA